MHILHVNVNITLTHLPADLDFVEARNRGVYDVVEGNRTRSLLLGAEVEAEHVHRADETVVTLIRWFFRQVLRKLSVDDKKKHRFSKPSIVVDYLHRSICLYE